MSRNICGVVLSAAAMIFVAGCGSSSSSKTTTKNAPEQPTSCGTSATTKCTPRVGPNESVTVDTLEWRVLGAKKSETIGDVSALGARANGVFVEVPVEVTNKKNESVTLTSRVVKLDANGKEYEPDSSATVAAIGAGKKPLFIETLGPDVKLESTVVFDVAQSSASGQLAMRFGELGLGSTKAFITLPALKQGTATSSGSGGGGGTTTGGGTNTGGTASLSKHCSPGLSATQGVSCELASNLFYEYHKASQGGGATTALKAWSPASKQYYGASCSKGTGVITCHISGTTDPNAKVQITQSALDGYTSQHASEYARTHDLGPNG